MSSDQSIHIDSVSVVVTAEFHNPSILNPDFLVSRGIAPETWAVAETLTTPPLSFVEYTNGVSLRVDPTRLTGTEPGGDGQRQEAHKLVLAYLRRLPHVPYRALGLNCLMSTVLDEPEAWLIEQFAPSWLSEEARLTGIAPKVTYDAGHGAVCHVGLAATDDGAGRVVVDCNVHHLGLSTVEGLCSAIEAWPDRLNFIASRARELLRRSRP